MKKPKNKPPIKRRKFPHFASLAVLGFWAKPIQKVVKKWKEELGEACCRDYLLHCVVSVRSGSSKIDVPLMCDGHRRYVLDLLQAADVVWNDDESLTKWVLELSSTASEEDWDYKTNTGHARSAERIQKLIEDRTSHKFSIDAINQTTRRLRLYDRTIA